jgi:DMSO/TMAO reductase YedYZ molybdopterin-dependent catalytic subunit
LLNAGAGIAACGTLPLEADAQLNIEGQKYNPDHLEYLTHDANFGVVERGDPIPYKQPEAKLREIGMTRDTWTLEVVPDLPTGTKIERPMSKSAGTALTFADLMKLAETRSVRYMKVITCNNLNTPLGMGLWEGVPLRDVIWLAKPVSDIRRVIYYGHHNEDPKQIFQGSLPLSRVLEDPPGHNPVMLAYKMNGQWLSGTRGGPVRMIVPEAYGFKSVKWIKTVVLTNLSGANDTYALENNDIDSWMKTCARFLTFPREVKSRQDIRVTGVAQIGISGLKKVQVWLQKEKDPMPPNDPYFTRALWQDAECFGPPTDWGGGLPDGKMPADVRGFDAAGKPDMAQWPMRYSIVHWSAALKAASAGNYILRCRAIDANGVAQPMPRPLPKSGMNMIEEVEIKIT